MQIVMKALLIGLFLVLVWGSIATILLIFRHIGWSSTCFKIIKFDDENLFLKERMGKRAPVILWSNIVRIYPPEPMRPRLDNCRSFTIKLLNGEAFEVTSSEQTGDLLEKFYDYWLQSIQGQIFDIKELEFSHPLDWIKKRFGMVRRSFMLYALITCFCLLIYVFRDFLGTNREIIAAIYALGSLCLLIPTLLLWLVAGRRRYIVTLRIIGDKIILRYHNGLHKEYSLSDIEDYTLAKTYSVVHFSGNEKLRSLEVLNNWPVLREYLLASLQQEDKKRDKGVQ